MRAAVSRLQIGTTAKPTADRAAMRRRLMGGLLPAVALDVRRVCPKAAANPGYRGTVRLSGHDMVNPI